jgi:hypothetical protein
MMLRRLKHFCQADTVDPVFQPHNPFGQRLRRAGFAATFEHNLLYLAL